MVILPWVGLWVVATFIGMYFVPPVRECAFEWRYPTIEATPLPICVWQPTFIHKVLTIEAPPARLLLDAAPSVDLEPPSFLVLVGPLLVILMLTFFFCFYTIPHPVALLHRFLRWVAAMQRNPL